MSVYETVRRSQVGPKRSGYVALALMATASFAASFAAGSALLNWNSFGWSKSAAARQSCTTKADGSQTCRRTDSGWRSRIFYYVSWGGSDDTNSRSSSYRSSKFSNAGTEMIGRKRTGAVRRSGFGSFSRSTSFRRFSVGG